MKGKVKKKLQLNTTAAVSFVFIFSAIILFALMLVNSKNVSAAYKMKVSDIIESVVSNDSKAAGEMLKENKIQDAVDQLLTQTLNKLVRSGNYEVTEEQSQQIEQSLHDMLTTMTEQDLIEFTQDGELSTFSKYYLADAVAYAVTSAIGNDTITVNKDTVDTQFVLDNLNNDVLDLRIKYESLANKYENITGSKFDSSNFQEILKQYAILDKETYNKLANGSNGTNGANGTNGTNGLDGESPESILEIMLKIQALETMVKTLTDTEYNNTKETLTSETAIQLDTITHEIENIKESMSNGDSPNPDDLYNVSELTENLLKLSEKVNGMDLSGIDRNNASILSEIQERQNAITQLQEQLKEVTNNNTESTETKTLVEKLESMTKELETLKSQVTVQNTANETNREVWTKETNTKVETILKQIETIQGADKTTSTTINNLKQTINNMQQTINNIQNDSETPDVDLSDVYSSIAAVKLQLMSGSDDPLETAFSNIAGNTVAAKIGSLSNDLTAESENLKLQQATYELRVTNKLNENITNLETSLNSSLNTQYESFNQQLNDFKKIVNNSGSKEEIDAAKKELETAIKDLQEQLNQTNNTTNTTIENNVTQLNNQLTELVEQINTVNENNATLTDYIDNNQTKIDNLYQMVDDDLRLQLEDTRTALQSNINSLHNLIGSEDDIGFVGEGLAGSNLYEKLGFVANKVNAIKSNTEDKNNQLSQSLADEQSARVASDGAIQKSLSDLQGMMSKLEYDITNSSEDNKTSITNTKSELLEEIASIYGELSDSTEDNKTYIINTKSELLKEIERIYSELSASDEVNEASIDYTKSELLEKLSKMYDELSVSDKGNKTSIDNTKSELLEKISNISKELSDSSVDNKTSIANTRDELLKEISDIYIYIYSELSDSSVNLEDKLSKTINKIEATNDWITDVRLNLNPGTESIYTDDQCVVGLSLTTDDQINYPNDKWNMWVIDQQKLAKVGKVVTFRAKNGTIPESDITIVYENNPVIVVKYKIENGLLRIYTPVDTKTIINGNDYVNIQTMHVQNASATNEG